MTAPTATDPSAVTRVVSEPAGARLDEWRAALALARIEGWRLLRSPAMIPGALLLLVASSGPREVSLRSLTEQSAPPCFMVAAMTMVAVNLAVRRGARHGTAELYGSTPMSAAARTGAHLLSVAWPAMATAFVLAAQLAYWVVGRGGYGPFSLAELAVGSVLVLGAGALAVLVTRVWSSVLVVPVTCVAIAAVVLFASTPLAPTSGLKHLAFWFGPVGAVLPPRPAASHLVYLLGLTALAALTALFIDRRRPALVGLVALVLAVTVAAGVVQFDALSPSAWAAADHRLADPDDGQVCRVLHGVRYCAFPDDAGLIPQWDRAVAGVRRAVPPDRFPGDLAVTERVSMVSLQHATGGLRSRLAGKLPHFDNLKPIDDGRLHPSPESAWEQLSSLDLAAGTAARTVGLPLAPRPTGTMCDPSGQGRAVVALWLAGQSTPRARHQLERLARKAVVALGEHRYVIVADTQGSTVLYGGVPWGEREVALALALLHRSQSQVTDDVARHWALLTDPTTSTEAVAKTLGLDPGARLRAPTVELAPMTPPADPIALSGPCP